MKSYVICCFWSVALIAIVSHSVDATYNLNSFTKSTYGYSGSMTFSGTPVPGTFDNVNVEVIHADTNWMRIRMSPTGVKPNQYMPYVIPEVVFPGNTQRAESYKAATNTTYQTQTLGNVITVSDSGGSQTILSLEDLFYETQFVSFTTAFPRGSFISGYGEHNYFYHLNVEGSTTLSIWNSDYGQPWQQPLYGYHPFVMVSSPLHGLHYAVLFLNSNAQQMSIDNDRCKMTFRSIGGQLNIFVITGKSPLEVISQYHRIIGTSAVPPYWVLGTHQSRWGYKSVSSLEDVVRGYKDKGIPLEVMWSDIDYMDNFRIFTTDPVNYPEPQYRAFIDRLHGDGQHYVQLIDPGVAYSNYSVYNDGARKNVFVRRNGSKDPIVNVVWPGWTVFPDFTSEVTTQWWHDQLSAYMKRIPLDGVWLDMNEIGSFCGGDCPVAPNTPWTVNWWTVNWDTIEQDVCMGQGHCYRAESSFNYPGFNPLTNGRYLFNKTLDMTADLALGKYYDVKSFYGFMESRATAASLQKQNNRRPFVLSRSTFVGSGKYATHWTGDNVGSWGERGMWDSVQAVLASNLWGINVCGADIGGLWGGSSEELMVRWTQLGAYHTFMRNHHGLDHLNQEWYRYSDRAIGTFRTTIHDRYQLLPFLFTELLKSHFNGGPVLRHPSLLYPSQSVYYQKEITAFFIGNDVYVVPVMSQGASSVFAFFPLGYWYHLWTGELLVRNNGGWVGLSAPLYDRMPALIRGGAALSLHTSGQMTVAQSRATGISILCAMDTNNMASGETWFDDGMDSVLTTKEALRMTSITCQGTGNSGSVKVSVRGNGITPHRLPLAQSAFVRILFPDNVVEPQKLVVNVKGIGRITSFHALQTQLIIELPVSTDGSQNLEVTWSKVG